MNRTDLIHQIARRASVPLKEVTLFWEAWETIVEATIREDNVIALQGFGTFHPWQQTERQGRNATTGTPITIRARKSIKFRPANGLLKAINKTQ